MTESAIRNRRYRDKKRGGPPRMSNQFWERVDTGGACWAWRGPRNRQGYGALWFHGVQWRAHRLAWHLTNGDIPTGLDVLHHCDNPGCVRPAHLFLGTDKQNAIDREQKGRGYRRMKLDPIALVHIVAARQAGVSGVKLARFYGVTHRTIYDAVRRVQSSV